ncbi:hypothetical protein BDW22DRAFT_928728 [Trametopsis cervina]|nr:hypothetical protein BDW22DRAFT_928728 [Trametopsis cervina]
MHGLMTALSVCSVVADCRKFLARPTLCYPRGKGWTVNAFRSCFRYNVSFSSRVSAQQLTWWLFARTHERALSSEPSPYQPPSFLLLIPTVPI